MIAAAIAGVSALCGSAFAGYRVIPPKTDVPYAQVDALAPIGMSLTNGVMFK